MKRLLITLGLLPILAALPSLAHADCVKSLHEVAQVDYNGANGLATIYLRTAPTGAATFFATTGNFNVIGMASDAVHTRTHVTVIGNAAVCPGAGNIGTVIRMIVPR